MSKEKNTRTRNYTSILYPESAPANWYEILQGHMVPMFISPLHDKDKDSEGNLKKEHYHLVIMYDSVKTLEQAKELVDSVNAVGCEKVASIRGCCRYLCHMDNPEKAQYPVSEIRSLCGADYFDIVESTSDKYKAISEMMTFCEQNDVSSFYLLCLYANRHRKDWYKVLCDSSAIFMREYLKSKKWSADMGMFEIINKETGEIIELR